jgi:cytoskeletal protein RodZ
MQDHLSTSGDDRQDSTLTFGQKLKSERERQGIGIADVAETTRIAHHHLRALERNDFDALPGDVFVKGYLRAYADYLDVDADLMIEDYVRQRESQGTAQAENDGDVVAEKAPSVPRVSDEKRRGRFSFALAAIGLTAIIAILVVWSIGSLDKTEPQRLQPEPNAAVPAVKTVAPPPRAATSTVEKEQVVVPVEKPPEEPAEAARIEAKLMRAESLTETTAEPTTLSIPDHGVGTAVENRQLVGESDRFTEGTKVWFWTRVRGGASGETIYHVWMREGVEKARVPLRLGGSHWRTQSNKTLGPESTGNWSVEARDAAGRVLARRVFVCAL